MLLHGCQGNERERVADASKFIRELSEISPPRVSPREAENGELRGMRGSESHRIGRGKAKGKSEVETIIENGYEISIEAGVGT